MKSYTLRCIACEGATVLTKHKHTMRIGLKVIQACVRVCVTCHTYWAIYTQPLPNNESEEIQKRIDKP